MHFLRKKCIFCEKETLLSSHVIALLVALIGQFGEARTHEKLVFNIKLPLLIGNTQI